MSPSQITFREVCEDDCPAVVELRRRVDDLPVPEKISTEFWQWENLRNPFGVSTAVVAVSEGRLVSHMSALPRRLVVDGRPHPCSHVVEAMTDRALRRSMVFLRLGHRLERLLCEQGRELFYCFPNRSSRSIFQRGFKWMDAGSSRLWLYPLRPGRVLASRPGALARALAPLAVPAGVLYRGLFAFRSSGRVETADKFDDRFQGLLDEVHRRGPVVLERTVDYLNWRYCRAVARKYTVLCLPGEGGESVDGYLVYRRLRHEGVELGVVMDLQVRESATHGPAGLLLCTALAQMDSSGAQAALCLLTSSDPLSRSLARSGFIPVPRRLNPNPLDFMIKPVGAGLKPAFICDPANWRLSFGDNDVF
ncbi:MAG: GNAT family N-acetyltransferase [Candidatus Glassbacteria bacterium]|nr:GNAT family N-acetyltransferase [Candidatus Glassbacteria bacterium]